MTFWTFSGTRSQVPEKFSESVAINVAPPSFAIDDDQVINLSPISEVSQEASSSNHQQSEEQILHPESNPDVWVSDILNELLNDRILPEKQKIVIMLESVLKERRKPIRKLEAGRILKAAHHLRR